MHIHIGKFTVGSLLGLVVPISLAWAQYVHPLNFPRMPQLEQIPSDYLFNIPLENALEELEQDSEWIELKEEAFHSDYEMQSTNLNDLNNSFEDFRMSDEFKKAKISISSNQLEKPILKPSSKSSDLELDHNFALTHLIKSSLQYTSTTPINNPVDIDWIESSHQEDISGKIETYPSHTSIFIRNSSARHIENHEMTSGKSRNKKNTQTLSYNQVLSSYPVYSGISYSKPSIYYNIFESETQESFSSITPSVSDDENIFTNTFTSRSFSRQRRADYTYEWEMADFYSSSTNDYFNFSGFSSSDTLTIRIKPILGGVNLDGNGSDVNSSATEGLNTPKYLLDGQAYSYDSGTGVQTGIDPGIWTDNVPAENWDREWSLMRITGQQPTVIIDDSAIKYYMNWHYGSFDTGGTGPNYNLLYYSAVPEPSTYFMTGILFCFIGCNRSSRNTIKTFLSKVFMRWKTKDITEDVQDRIS